MSDRRVLRTKKNLKKSLIELLRDKPISKISVSELCDMADVNRSTFYNYYLDIYDMLDKLENESLDNINSIINQYVDNETSTLYEKALYIEILDEIKANKDIFTLFFITDREFSFEPKLQKSLYNLTFANSKYTDKDVNYYVIPYAISGISGIINFWMKNGMSISTEDIGELIHSLVKNGYEVCNNL